jgi:hypothetical protein
VELRIDPEPDPEEREAIELALERMLGDEALPAAYTSRWRAVGVAENVGGDPA